MTTTRLAPARFRDWRCRCGHRHPHIWDICPYTNVPRETP